MSVKYAIDLKSKEIFAIGFFGASVREGAGGKALTNAELYVMPEFRKLGIAQKMVSLSFDLAQNDGIKSFDSITYRVQNHDALFLTKSRSICEWSFSYRRRHCRYAKCNRGKSFEKIEVIKNIAFYFSDIF